MRLSRLLLIPCTALLAPASLLAANDGTQNAPQNTLEEVLITGSVGDKTLKAHSIGVKSADSAQILNNLPGADVNTNGPLTGITHYRGLFGSRVSTHIDGMNTLTGGPNWMDPPLSYAPGLWIESIELHRGIAPVSKSVNSLGGHINATLKKVETTDSDAWAFTGEINSQLQSNNDALGLSVIAGSAKSNAAVWVRALTEQADDQDFPSGTIKPTEYDRSRIDLGGEYQWDKHTISGFIGRNETGESGTPALPMDIIYIDSNLARLNYQYQKDQLTAKVTLTNNSVEHVMNNFTLRPAPTMKMRYRSTLAEGDSTSAKIDFIYTASKNYAANWRWGIETSLSEHSATISNPNNAMFFVNNFNKAKLDILSAYVEQQTKPTDQWHADIGIRFSKVENNSGEVASSMAMMMPAVKQLRDKFNNSDRKQSDNLIDWHINNTFVFDQSKDRTQKTIVGLSRKSRSASYQERYLWLPMQATAGLADGNTYIGNLNLDPEISHQIELGYEVATPSFSLSPRVFFQRIHDYIQGTKTNNPAAIMVSTMMGSNKPALQFTNIDAEIYGFDLYSRFKLTHNMSLEANTHWIKGVQTDGNEDNLYRISPPRISLALLQTQEKWHYGAKWLAVKKQTKVAVFNQEKPTAGYALVDVFAQYSVNEDLHLNAAIDNVFDRKYKNHLGGYNRAKQKDLAIGDRISGVGRNIQLGLDYTF